MLLALKGDGNHESKKILYLGGTICILLFILFLYFNEENSRYIRAEDHDDAIRLGLQAHGLDEENILFIEPIKDNEEFIFFSSDSAIGFACLSKNKDEWLWKFTESEHGFYSQDKSSYMTSKIKTTTIKKHNYYLYLREIFNPKINKIALHNDTVNARIVKADSNTFWAAVIDAELASDDYLDVDIKAYDELGNIIK